MYFAHSQYIFSIAPIRHAWNNKDMGRNTFIARDDRQHYFSLLLEGNIIPWRDTTKFYLELTLTPTRPPPPSSQQFIFIGYEYLLGLVYYAGFYRSLSNNKLANGEWMDIGKNVGFYHLILTLNQIFKLRLG